MKQQLRTIIARPHTQFLEIVFGIFFGEKIKNGPNGELGGTPYSYESFSWSETYKNPGYGISSDGKPTKIENVSKNEKQ